jgi:nitroreductase
MAKEMKLPKPKEKGPISIEETLNKRRSVRDYKKDPLGLEEISQLLWSASGKNLYRRTAPSAEAAYPLQIYIEKAPISIIIAADYAKTTSYYGQRGISLCPHGGRPYGTEYLLTGPCLKTRDCHDRSL